MNMLEATLERRNGGLTAKVGSQELNLGSHVLEARPALGSYTGKKVILGIRPEDFEDAQHAPDRPSDERLRGEVNLREALGSEIMVHFKVDAKQALTDDVRELAKDVGEEAAAEEAAASGETTLVGRFDPRSQLKERETATVAVDTRNLHFFDLESGAGIYDESH